MLMLLGYGRDFALRLRGAGTRKSIRLRQAYVVTGLTDSASGRATRTGDANKDVRNRRNRQVPSNNPDHKIQVL